jgi:polyhydroxybutyrate depolymerase
VSARVLVLLFAAALVGAVVGPIAPAGAARAPVVKASKSTGCTSGTAVTPGETHQSIDSNGVTYTYIEHVPPASDGTTPLPLVIDFHGYSETAGIHVRTTMLGAMGDTKGFITITPQGPGPVPLWDTSLGGADVKFVGTLLDQVESTLCVDTNRVFATGYSNGAFMSSAVACAYADRVAAVAPVAGIRDIKGCRPTRPVPIVTFHGTKDPFVAFNGGYGSMVASLPNPDGSGRSLGQSTSAAATRAAAKGPSIPKITSDWAKRNDCASRPSRAKIGDDVTVVRYRCPKNATVELYRIQDGGHAWPGSQFSKSIAPIIGRTTFTISADDVIWKFFQNHPLTKS